MTISSPIVYRQAGEAEWHPGQIVNVSRTGVLFRVPRPPPALNAPVELAFTLVPSGVVTTKIRTRGRVTRIADPAEGERVSVAATVEEYEFVSGVS